jgi:hypothetical protein
MDHGIYIKLQSVTEKAGVMVVLGLGTAFKPPCHSNIMEHGLQIRYYHRDLRRAACSWRTVSAQHDGSTANLPIAEGQWPIE